MKKKREHFFLHECNSKMKSIAVDTVESDKFVLFLTPALTKGNEDGDSLCWKKTRGLRSSRGGGVIGNAAC